MAVHPVQTPVGFHIFTMMAADTDEPVDWATAERLPPGWRPNPGDPSKIITPSRNTVAFNLGVTAAPGSNPTGYAMLGHKVGVGPENEVPEAVANFAPGGKEAAMVTVFGTGNVGLPGGQDVGWHFFNRSDQQILVLLSVTWWP